MNADGAGNWPWIRRSWVSTHNHWTIPDSFYPSRLFFSLIVPTFTQFSQILCSETSSLFPHILRWVGSLGLPNKSHCLSFLFFPCISHSFPRVPLVLIEIQLNLQNVYHVNFSLHSGLFQIARFSTSRQKLSRTSLRPLTREIFPPNRKQTTNIGIMLCTEIHADGIYINMRCCEFVVGGFVVLDQQSLSQLGQ